MSKRVQWGVGFQEQCLRHLRERERGGGRGGLETEEGRNDTGESKLIIFMVHLPQSAWHSHTATKGKEKAELKSVSKAQLKWSSTL